MFTLIDTITAGFLGAIDAGQQALAVFALPILAICALISYYREYSATVMSSGAGLGDYLAHALTLLFAAGCYMFVLLQLFAIAQAALDTVFFWGLLGAGGGISSAQLTQPSFIFEAGMKAAKPIADFDTWFRGVYSAVRLVANPTDLIAYWLIIASFAGITLHTMMMLIEYHLAVMLASVLIPWGIWRLTSGIAEFSLGWLTGSLIRALVSSAMVGIATPLFDLLNQPLPSTGFFSIPQTFLLLCSSVMYLILCWTIPSLASRLAGQASLGLTGSTLTLPGHLTHASTFLMEVPMARSRLSHADAMTLWRARDIYRVQAVLKGLVLLFFVVEFFGYCAVGYWWLGPLVIACQCGLLWCLRWGLRWLGRWAHQGLWWCIDHAQTAVQTGRRAHRR